MHKKYNNITGDELEINIEELAQGFYNIIVTGENYEEWGKFMVGKD